MNTYLWVKWVHIMSSVLLVGTGLGSAFYLYFANRTRNVAAIAVVTRLVVRADFWFTTPAVVLQPLTGFVLVQQAGYLFSNPWLAAALALYALAVLCWLPVVWLQWRMAAMAQRAFADQTTLPERYWTYARWWEGLGYPAFAAMLMVFYLMVTKPSLNALPTLF